MGQTRSERSLTVLSGAARSAAQPRPAFPEMEADEPPVPLSHYLWILKRHRWRIISFVTACVIATLVVSMRIQPIY